MKKFVLTALLAFSASVYANDSLRLADSYDAPISEPVFRFGAKEMSGTVAYWLPHGHVFSKNNLKQGFCWELSHLPKDVRMVNVRQTMIAPKEIQFKAFVDGKWEQSYGREIVNTIALEAQDGRVGSCGNFEASDPTGEYQIIVEANGVRYPMQSVMLK